MKTLAASERQRRYWKYTNTTVTYYKNFNPAGFLLSFEENNFHYNRSAVLQCRLKDEYLAKQMDVEQTWQTINESKKLLLLHSFQESMNKILQKIRSHWFNENVYKPYLERKKQQKSRTKSR